MILGISFDSVRENAAFAEKYDFPFELLSDPERSVGLAYGATEAGSKRGAKRISYLIDENGNIQVAYDNVMPSKHAKNVLADLGA